jgi:hypothetical protein
VSESTISHRTRSADVTIGTATASSTTIDLRDCAAGILHVDNPSGTATITMHGSHDGLTFAAVYGFDGQASTITVPAGGGACALPDSLYAMQFVRFVAGADLGTSAVTTITLKS